MPQLNARTIAIALGGSRVGDGYMARCPAHRDREPSLSLRDRGDLVLFHCHAGCSQADVIEALRARDLWQDHERSLPRVLPLVRPMPPLRDDRKAQRKVAALQLWGQADDPRGTLAEKYLASRGLFLDPAPCLSVIRFLDPCPFVIDGVRKVHPAMLCLFRGILRNEPVAVQCFAVNRDGSSVRKADGSRLKHYVGPVGDAAIKVSADEDVEQGLGLAEGFETTLAVVQKRRWRPMWATGSAGTMRKFPALPGVGCLTLFVDNDANETGRKAAEECAARWQAAGCEVAFVKPPRIGSDWADYD